MANMKFENSSALHRLNTSPCIRAQHTVSCSRRFRTRPARAQQMLQISCGCNDSACVANSSAREDIKFSSGQWISAKAHTAKERQCALYSSGCRWARRCAMAEMSCGARPPARSFA
eukprot:Skav213565  [mRNA]  locus=scaffold3630:146358:164071:- [translate_table: standard]